VTRFAGKSIALSLTAVIALALLAFPAAASQNAFISHLHRIRTLAPTAPKNGSALVETSPGGHRVALKPLVRNGGGDLFGLAVAPRGRGLYFVNDSGSGPTANSLQLLH
jgi:hypothetical protein